MSQSLNYSSLSLPDGPSFVVRSTDNATIPCVLDNMDYQAFLAWIAAGNTAPSGWTGPTNPTGASS